MFEYKRATSYGRRVTRALANAEKALGKRVPKGAIVHHASGDWTDDSNENLVICPSAEYHRLLHKRMDAMRECGNPNFVKCQFCKKWDDPERMVHVKKTDRPSTTFFHYSCRSERAAKRRFQDENATVTRSAEWCAKISAGIRAHYQQKLNLEKAVEATREK